MSPLRQLAQSDPPPTCLYVNFRVKMLGDAPKVLQAYQSAAGSAVDVRGRVQVGRRHITLATTHPAAPKRHSLHTATGPATHPRLPFSPTGPQGPVYSANSLQNEAERNMEERLAAAAAPHLVVEFGSHWVDWIMLKRAQARLPTTILHWRPPSRESNETSLERVVRCDAANSFCRGCHFFARAECVTEFRQWMERDLCAHGYYR